MTQYVSPFIEKPAEYVHQDQNLYATYKEVIGWLTECFPEILINTIHFHH